MKLWTAVVAPFAKRAAAVQAAFEPIVNLHPAILDNTFGVYFVEFDDASALSHSTVHKVLGLNRIPDECDLTLVIRTFAVTALSAPTLSQLTSPGAIVLDGTGLTDAGIARLDASLPSGTLSRRQELDTNRRNDGDR